MAFKTTTAFLGGVATGWVLRSVLGSSRDVVVRGVVVAHQARERARRAVAENVEWLDDVLAEGRARYHSAQGEAPLDDSAPPEVRTPQNGAHPEHAA